MKKEPTVRRGDVRSIQGRVEQLDRVVINVISLDLHTAQELIPRVARCRARPIKVERGDLRLCVRTCLRGRDERDAYAHVDLRFTCVWGDSVAWSRRLEKGVIPLPFWLNPRSAPSSLR